MLDWEWDGNGNDYSGMGGNGNNSSHSRTPLISIRLFELAVRPIGDWQYMYGNDTAENVFK